MVGIARLGSNVIPPQPRDDSSKQQQQGAGDHPAQPQYSKAPQENTNPQAPSEPTYSPHYFTFSSGSTGTNQSDDPTIYAASDTTDAGTAPGDVTTVSTEEVTPSTDASNANEVIAQKTADYDAAKNDVDAANKELQAQLSTVGPGLTEEQKYAYIEEYKEKHSDIYAAEAKAAEELQASLDAAVEYGGDPNLQSTTVKNALDRLSGSSRSAETLSWINDNLKPDASGNYPFGMSLAEIEEIAASATSAAMDAAAASSDPKSSFKQIVDTLDNLKKTFQGSAEIAAFAASASDLLTAFGNGPDAVKDYFKNLSDSGVSDSFKASGYLIAAASVANGFVTGMENASAKDMASFLSDCASLLAGGAESLENMVKNGDGFVAALAKKSTNLLSIADNQLISGTLKVLEKGLGAIANALSLAGTLDEVINDPNAGEVIEVIGALVAFVPGLQVAGALIGIVGSIVDDMIEGQEQRDEMRDILLSMGDGNMFTEEQATTLSSSAGANLALDAAGYTPEQIQTLAKDHPELFTPDNATAFTAAADMLGLEGDDMLAFADAVDATGSGSFNALSGIMNENGWSDEKKMIMIVCSPENGVLSEAAKFLQQRDPTLRDYAEDSYQAKNDADTHASSPEMSWSTVIDDLSANTSDAYRASYIATLNQQQDKLELYTDTIAASGSQEQKQAYKASLQAAYEANVIDEKTYQDNIDRLDA